MTNDTIDALTLSLSGSYAIERELGAGGMATVYLARDRKHQRDVAIKVLRSDVAASVGRERFLREIQLAAKLSHPHILALHDSGDAGGALYYVMPNVEGSSLRDRMDAGPLPIDDAVRIAREIASALDYAHRHDVVHRDIKPENIMLQDGHVLVADFGLGKAVSDVAGNTLTQVGTSMGTPAYMSPEQAVGEDVDGRSDIYSLGCVLYEMLVGEPPFTGPNVQAVIAKRFVQLPADVSALRDGVTRPVARAVQKSLARAPIDRFQTAAELLAALREVDAKLAATKTSAPKQSIAVLPLENLSSDKENEYFGDGIAEEIINALAQIEGLHVAARTSAFSFKGKHEDLRSIGEKLNVATVLEGSVRKAGTRLRITAQLIDVADGYHLWSERYDRELVDVFAVQDEIAAAIAAKLQVTFDKPAAATRERATPEQVEAYETYIRGRAVLVRRLNLLDAVASFERVIALDPRHARAHASLADAYRLIGQFGLMPQDESMSMAKSSVARALEIDPGLAEALSIAAVIAISWENDPDRAIEQWQRALELNPSLSEGRVMLAEYGLLFARGDEPRAADEARRAVRDDPQSSIVAALAAQTLSMSGHLDEGLTLALHAAELDERGMTAIATTALVLCASGDAARARSYAERGRVLGGRSALGLAISATVEGGLGNTRRADAYHRELLARSELEDVSNVPLAMTASAAGRSDEAMRYAMLAIGKGELLSGTLVRWPMFVAIREHAEFAELQRRVEAWGTARTS
jgi:eukaryotic-like serine/threonine-protein kinase